MRVPLTNHPCRGALVVAVVAVVATLGPSRRAVATPSQDLDNARQAFRAGDYASAIPILTTLLYPTPRLARTEDLSEAHALLGVCQFETADRPGATREFEQALFLRSDYALDALLFSREVVRFFDQVKTDVTARAERDRALRALADEKDRLRKYRESLIVYEVHPYYVNFVPFGAGQFQNGQRGRGLVFAVGEGLTGAASAGLWLYLVSNYGYGGSVPPGEAAGARRLQQIEIGAGAAFLGLYAWGVIDALVHYKPRAQIQGDDSLLPPDLRPPAPRRESSLRDRLHLAPTLLPGGGGAALSLEY
jgi:tetratricopeptide (TPR) repeat protein